MKSGEPLGLSESEMRSRIESLAMGKVCDLASLPYVTHGTLYEKLPNILQQGVISGNFAQRIGDSGYSSEWGDSSNKKFVSTVEGFIGWGEEIEVIIRNGPAFKKSQYLAPGSHEVLFKNRIAPREFLGLAASIRERRRSGYEERVERMIEEAIEIWRSNPQNALPVYNLLDRSLVWPKRMTHEELVEWIGLGVI